MAVKKLFKWEFSFDKASTETAYREIEFSSLEMCGCKACRHFLANRKLLYEESFVSVLRELGIDPKKEMEVFCKGNNQLGHLVYQGWFHFAGAVLDISSGHEGSEPNSDFYRISKGVYIRISSKPEMIYPVFRNLRVLQLDFVIIINGQCYNAVEQEFK